MALLTQGWTAGGGVPTVARWLRDGLIDSGYDVVVHDLATSSRDAASRRLTAPATWLRRSIGQPLGSSGTDRHWGANAVELEPMRYCRRSELTRALRAFDVIQVVSGAPALANAARGAGVPVVLQAATRVRWERQSQLAAASGPLTVWRAAMTRLVDRVERRALRSVDAVLVWNEDMLQAVRPHCRGRLGIAAPGVDVDRFRPHPDGWRRRGPLLSVCRLSDPRKGLDRLIRAYALLVDAEPAVPDLVLAGRGRLPLPESDLVAHLGLTSRVRVRSDVTADELPGLYRDASVFLQASFEEGFGLSVVEAMASGLPVVTTGTAGTRVTVLDGRTGWLVPQQPSDDVPRALADRVLDVLRASGPEMSRRARERAESSFDARATLARFTRTYDEVVSAS
ncbi:glycosyltransferase family 4 protein [Geodermatophilus sp. CPCC 205506]|uniref:glycosyltransferase family 4 protein n=1 Tax=Geodermatophilus sp. CPCC 205506 TaxID=2936596 RepID=UPI003EEDE3E8